MHDWLQLAIGGVIVAAVILTVHRSGQRNPQSTGALGRQVNKLFALVRQIEAGQGSCATKAELGLLAGEVRALEARAATSLEVLALEGKINLVRGEIDTLAERVSALKETGDHTREAILRVEAILMKGALDR